MAFLPTPQLPIGQRNRQAESCVHPHALPVRVAVRATANRPISVTRRRRLLDFLTIFSAEPAPEEAPEKSTRSSGEIKSDLLKRYANRQELLRRHAESVHVRQMAERNANIASKAPAPTPVVASPASDKPSFSTPYSSTVRTMNYSYSGPTVSTDPEPSESRSESSVPVPDTERTPSTPSPSASGVTAAVVDAPKDVVPKAVAPTGSNKSSVSVPSVGGVASSLGDQRADDATSPPSKPDRDLVEKTKDTVATLYSPPSPTITEGTEDDDIKEQVQDVVVEQPVVEEPVAAEPEPIVEEPEPVVEEPVAAEPEPIVEEPAPVVEEPVAVEPEPVVEEPVAQEPEPAIEEPFAEAPVVEEPVVEEPVVEEPVVEEPVAEEPVAEEPVVEAPVVEEPMVEEPVAEEPVVEEPVVEEPAAEEWEEETPVVPGSPIGDKEPDVEEPVAEQPIEEATDEESEDNVVERDGAVKRIGKVVLDAIVDGVSLKDSDIEAQEPDEHKSYLLELVKSGKIRNLTVMKLRRLLSSAALKTSGRKSELIARLISFAKSK